MMSRLRLIALSEKRQSLLIWGEAQRMEVLLSSEALVRGEEDTSEAPERVLQMPWSARRAFPYDSSPGLED